MQLQPWHLPWRCLLTWRSPRPEGQEPPLLPTHSQAARAHPAPPAPPAGLQLPQAAARQLRLRPRHVRARPLRARPAPPHQVLPALPAGLRQPQAAAQQLLLRLRHARARLLHARPGPPRPEPPAAPAGPALRLPAHLRLHLQAPAAPAGLPQLQATLSLLQALRTLPRQREPMPLQ